MDLFEGNYGKISFDIVKKISKQAMTVVLLAVAIFAVPRGNTANASKSKCISVNNIYPFGIALNKQSIGTSRAEVNRKKYIQFKYLDKDLDGIVCEIEKLQTSNGSTTPVTSSYISSAVSYPGYLGIERYQTQGGIPQQSNSVYKKCASGSSDGLNANLAGCPTTNLLTHITGSFRIDFGITGSEHYIWFLSRSKDGIVVTINGQKIIDQWTTRPKSDVKVLGGYFKSGEKYPIEIWSFNSDGLPENALWFGVDGMNWTAFSNNADCTLGCRISLFTEIGPVSNYWRTTGTQSVTTVPRTAITQPRTFITQPRTAITIPTTTINPGCIGLSWLDCQIFMNNQNRNTIPQNFITTSTTSVQPVSTTTLPPTTTTTVPPTTTTTICVPDSYEVSRLNFAIQPWNNNYYRTRALFVYEGRTDAVRMLDSYTQAMRDRYDSAMRSINSCVRVYWEITNWNSITWPNR